jgi:glc operon protein GlcG
MNKLMVMTAALLAALNAVAMELPEKKVLTLEAAKQVAAAAAAEAQRRHARVVIAVVDDGGYPVYLERGNGAQVASSQVAIDKARTAAIYRRPSKVFEEQVSHGRASALALSGAAPLQGGLPLVAGEDVVGAIGVSGETPQEDEDIARVGAEALAAGAAAAPVTYLDHAAVAAAFTRGAPLLETPEYKVHASRRTDPGLVEVHEYETDVVYVLEGAATFVTGGRLLDGKVIAPGEIRGTRLEGGSVQQLAPGDVVVVPRGTPHWFREIQQAPFLYFVVKPISMAGGAS